MIPLHRERSAQAISEKFRGAKKKRKDLELLKAYREVLRGGVTKVPFQAAFWKTAKVQLIEESGGKCAYCEANTDVVAHGDVEHYRPKSIYWWLAYTYDNYLYACQICNQSYKGDHFPVGSIQPLAAPVVSAHSTDAELQQLVGLISPDPLAIDIEYTLHRYKQEHEQEKAFLLNPYFDDPQEYFAYQADDLTQEVIIVPAKPIYIQQVKAAENFYGLNRIELKNFRYKIYKIFQVMKHSLNDLKNETLRAEVQQQLQAMQTDKYLFAGMNRYFAAKP